MGKDMALASGIIGELKDIAEEILTEIEAADPYLERGWFILCDLVSLTDAEPQDGAALSARDQFRANMLARIAGDYMARVQDALDSVVIRKRKELEKYQEGMEG